MIQLDDQPFSLVKDEGFHWLIHHLTPRYSLPSWLYFAGVSLPVVQAGLVRCK